MFVMAKVKLKSIVKFKMGKDDYYLESLFPIKWSAFISSAKSFENENDARLQINSRYTQISEMLNHDCVYINSIMIDTYDDGKLISSAPYIGGDKLL